MKLPKNWRQHLSIEKTVYSKTEIEYTLKLTLPHKVQPIIAGYIYIIKKRSYNFVKVVSVIPALRGKGCGTMLYEYVIAELKSLSTHYHEASSLAQRVWRKLVKKYNYTGNFFTGVLTVYDKSVDKKPFKS